MSVRNVLVLGDSPHAAGLLEQLEQDPGSRRQPEASELPDLAILAGSEEADLAVRSIGWHSWPPTSGPRSAAGCQPSEN